MNPTFFQIYAALFMVVVTVALFIWLQGSEAAASARRMMRMMTRIGLDPGIATHGDPRTTAIMEKARHRCRKCRFEDCCELWRRGGGVGDNSFCPNARTFQSLTETSTRAA